MKKVIALTFAVSTFFIAGCCSTHHATTWEYKIVEGWNYAKNLEPKLNDLAKEGWNVVSMSTFMTPGASTPETQVILRRPRSQ